MPIKFFVKSNNKILFYYFSPLVSSYFPYISLNQTLPLRRGFLSFFTLVLNFVMLNLFWKMIIAHKVPSTGTAQKRQSPAAVFGHALLPKKKKIMVGSKSGSQELKGKCQRSTPYASKYTIFDPLNYIIKFHFLINPIKNLE